MVRISQGIAGEPSSLGVPKMHREKQHDGDRETTPPSRFESQLHRASNSRGLEKGFAGRVHHPGTIGNYHTGGIDVQSQHHVPLHPTPIHRHRIPKRQLTVHHLRQFVGRSSSPPAFSHIRSSRRPGSFGTPQRHEVTQQQLRRVHCGPTTQTVVQSARSVDHDRNVHLSRPIGVIISHDH